MAVLTAGESPTVWFSGHYSKKKRENSFHFLSLFQSKVRCARCNYAMRYVYGSSITADFDWHYSVQRFEIEFQWKALYKSKLLLLL